MSTIPSVKEVRKDWVIPKNGEFRFEVELAELVVIKLLTGTAEVFGMELSPNREYEVSGTKLAIFTYEGAKVQIKGKCEVEYVSEDTTMNIYLNTHLAIEGLRQEAALKHAEAPRIIVMGQSRSTLARILSNYAIRAGRAPMYVDLDIANGALSLPGSIGAQVLDKVIDLDDGILEGQPINYFVGSTNPTESMKLYKKMMARLAFSVNGRLSAMSDEQTSGAIIGVPTSSEELIGEIYELFKPSLVLVIGNERLYITVTKILSDHSECTVLKIPKSGGVVSKDPAWRKQQIQNHFQRYFYGPKKEYSPFSLTLSFDEIAIRRLGEDLLAPRSALPLGASRKIDESKAAKVEPTASMLLYSILGVSWAQSEEEVAEANVAGFVYVTAVDETKKQITLLSICPGKLPSKYLLLGNLKWIEK